VNIRVNSISDALFSGLGVSDNSSSYKTAMITEQLDKLIDAAKAFLEDKGFGAIEIEEVMDDVFGDDCTGTEAVEWKGYWKELELYKEKLAEDPLNAGAAPKVSCNYLFSVLNIPTSSCLQTPASSSNNGSQADSMDIDTPAHSSQPTASQDMAQALQTGPAERTIKRNHWRLNSNQFLRKAKPGGAKLDELCAKLAIERVEQKANGNGTCTYFYCIGCDERRVNNSRSHVLPHAKKCKVCTRIEFVILTVF
jgi:hypothetical protein